MTSIRYFIPTDGDDEAHPNIFLLPSTQQPPLLLSQVRSSFPLPGAFHYRAKTNLGKGHVWLDVVDGNELVPSFRQASGEQTITLKLTRLEQGGDYNPPSRPVPARAPAPAQARAAPAPSAPSPRSTTPPPPQTGSLLFDVDEPSASAPPTPQRTASPAQPAAMQSRPSSDFLSAETSASDELLNMGMAAAAVGAPAKARGVSEPAAPAAPAPVVDPFAGGGDDLFKQAGKPPLMSQQPPQQQQRQSSGGGGFGNNGMGGVGGGVQQGNFDAFNAFANGGQGGNGGGGMQGNGGGAFGGLGNMQQQQGGNRGSNGRHNSTWN
ncbi:hypothetical protein TeGR_g8453 [Tetraparma gracilis]|uniref:DIX domain-containing protein n=1 Tax=Tetraparma gracilis TaxID=2962635 RepID=A0ABQ6MVH6_9STRA|nr:hypothetical protein TeGR_g8453 [Tetraparma gracilis]